MKYVGQVEKIARKLKSINEDDTEIVSLLIFAAQKKGNESFKAFSDINGDQKLLIDAFVQLCENQPGFSGLILNTAALFLAKPTQVKAKDAFFRQLVVNATMKRNKNGRKN